MDQRVGKAGMKGGGAAVAVSEDKRMELINSVQGKWNETVQAACGAELAGSVLSLFADNAP